jgi:hypothetical protein
MESEEYNGLLCRLENMREDIDNVTLDILEIFAQTEAITTSQITSFVKSTKIERAYKNVHNRVKKLKSLKLIEETNLHGKHRHNEKYYKLRDEGIYTLFLNRLHGVLVNQLSVRKRELPVSYVHNFLKYYGDNLIFKLFLYPYFDKHSITIDNFELIVKLFNYIHNCCKHLDLALRVQVPVMITKFSWNKIPGQDDMELFTSIREIFGIEDIDRDKLNIVKTRDNNTIKVITPQRSIVIELDRTSKKAIAILTDKDNSLRKYEYDTVKFGSEIMVGATQPHEESMKGVLESSRKLIELPIYELVSNLGYELVSNLGNRSTLLEDKMGSTKVLAQDEKFMTLLQDIHDNLHNNFERGYNRVRMLRDKS